MRERKTLHKKDLLHCFVPQIFFRVIFIFLSLFRLVTFGYACHRDLRFIFLFRFPKITMKNTAMIVPRTAPMITSDG